MNSLPSKGIKGERWMQLLSILVKKDITLKKASAAMNINVSTANKHIRKAKERVGVKSFGALVYKATSSGVLENVESEDPS